MALPGVAYAETGTPDPGNNTANESPAGNLTPNETPSGPTPEGDGDQDEDNDTSNAGDDTFDDDTLGNGGDLDEQIDGDDDDIPALDPPADENLADELDPPSAPDQLPPLAASVSELPITPTDPAKEGATADPVLTSGAPAGSGIHHGSTSQSLLRVDDPLDAGGEVVEGLADDQPTFRTFLTPNEGSFAASNLLQGNMITALEVAPPAQPQPSFFDSLLAIPGTLIGGVLDLVSGLLAPIIGPGGILNSPFLWGALLSVRRQFDQAFSNSAPVLQPVTTGQDLDDGQVHGTFGGVDPDGDSMTYTVPARGAVGGPAHGTVTINQAAGTWTYTPDNNGTPTNYTDDYRGPDSFTVTASDAGNGFHIHAFGQTHTSTKTVNFTVAAITPPPGVVGQIPIGVGTLDYYTNYAPGAVGNLVFNNDRSLAYQVGYDIDHDQTVVTVLKPDTGQPSNPITIAGRPFGELILSPDGSRAYQLTLTRTDSTPLPPSTGDGNAYLTVPVRTTVTVIDTATGTSPSGLDPATVDGVPNYSLVTDPTAPPYYRMEILKFNADGTRAQLTTTNYVDEDTYAVGVLTVDSTTGELIGSDTQYIDSRADYLPSYNQFVTVVENGDISYLTTQRSKYDDNGYDYLTTVTLIDSSTGTFLGGPSTVNGNGSVRISPDGSRAFLIGDSYGPASTEVAIINTDDGSLVGGQPLIFDGDRHLGLGFNEDGSLAYIPFTGSSDGIGIAVINVVDGSLVGGQVVTIDGYTSSYGAGLRFNKDRTRAFMVTDTRTYNGNGYDDGSLLTVFDTSAGALGTDYSQVTFDGKTMFVTTPDPSRALLGTSLQEGYVTEAREIRILDLDAGVVIGSGPIVLDGGYASAAAFNGDGSRAFLAVSAADGSSTTVTVIDTTVGSLIGSTPVTADGAVGQIRLSPDGEYILLVTATDDEPDSYYVGATSHVTVIDVTDGTRVGEQMSVGGQYPALYFDDDNVRLYLRTSDASTDDGPFHTTVTVINIASGSIVGLPITFDNQLIDFAPHGGSRPEATDFVLAADGDRAYQITRSNDFAITSLAILDTTNGTLVKQITVPGTMYYWPVVSPDGTRVVIDADDALYLIDTSDGSILGGGPIPLIGSLAGAVTYSPDGARAYQITRLADPVAGTNSTAITIIDTADGAIIGQPVVIAGDPSGRFTLNDEGSLAFQLTRVLNPATGHYGYSMAVIDTALTV